MERTTGQMLESKKIEPFTLIHDIVVNWWVIVLGALAASMAASVILGMAYVPRYTTTATFVVSARNTAASFSYLSTANKTAVTFQKIIESSAMQKILCTSLGVDEIDADIQADVAEGTNLLELRVTASTPKESFDIMDGILNNYSQISYYTVGDVVLNILKNPSVPFSPDNPYDSTPMMKKVFVFAAAALILLIGFLSFMQDTLKRESDIEENLDARSLGVITYGSKYRSIREFLRRRKKALLITDPLAGFEFVESYRKFSGTVEYRMEKQGFKTLVITSVSENEGKSTVAANLAISLAERENKVILIDGDLRRPSQFLIFGLHPGEHNEIGEFIKSSHKGAFHILMKTEMRNLRVACGRNCYSTSTDILQQHNIADFLQKCRNAADYVIVDTPPTAVLGDAELWGQNADTVLFVERQNFMHAEDINDMLDKFRTEKTKILGVVLNGVRTFGGLAGAAAGRYGAYGVYGNYMKKQKGHDHE